MTLAAFADHVAASLPDHHGATRVAGDLSSEVSTVVAVVSVLVGVEVEFEVESVLAPAVTVAGPPVVGSPLVSLVVEVSWPPGLKQASSDRNDPTKRARIRIDMDTRLDADGWTATDRS